MRRTRWTVTNRPAEIEHRRPHRGRIGDVDESRSGRTPLIHIGSPARVPAGAVIDRLARDRGRWLARRFAAGLSDEKSIHADLQ